MQDPAAGRRGGFREHVEGLRVEHLRRVRAPEEGVRFLLAIGWRLPMLRLVIAVTATATTVAATDNVVAAPTITVPSPPPLQLPSPDP